MEHSFDPLDNLEDLPSQEAIEKKISHRSRGGYFPYKRAIRWAMAFVGKREDEVFSKWTELSWVPEKYRNREGFERIFEPVIRIDGVLYNSRYKVVYTPHRYNAFYIDPDTKLIGYIQPNGHSEYKKRQEESKAKQELTCRIIGDWHQYFKFDGLWYEIKFKFHEWVSDPVTYYWKLPWKFKPDPKRPYNSSYHYITFKRQLSNKELKQNNLQNDIKEYEVV